MTPTGALQIGTNEAKYIDEGRALFRQRFPIGSFDDPSWDIRHLRSSQHKAANARVYFTRYRFDNGLFAAGIRARGEGICAAVTCVLRHHATPS